jgi:pentatricopeptide repeat protein
MSANATSLRRILRSIGTHATPTTTITTRASSNLAPHAEPSIRYVEPTIRESFSSRKQFFLANRALEHKRMKERAQRHLLSKERSEIPEEKAWQDVLRLLEQDSPTGAEDYIKRMETIRLPEGIFAKWIRDPGESILEVMQRTGSHVQIIPGKQVGHFSSLTLLGRPAQNAAAKKLLQESDLLAAISEDDLNTSKSLADYHLRTEISNRHGEALQNPDGVEVDDFTEDDQLDNIDIAQLENAVFVATSKAPTRAVWSESATVNAQRMTQTKDREVPQGETTIAAPKSALPNSAIAFTARIEQLTAPRPHKPWRLKPETSDDANHSIRDELVALMVNPMSAGLITPVATGKALQYLAHHMYFPAVREVLNALKDVKLQLSAETFNTLLDAAALNENVVAFHYIVNTMRSRNVIPNAGTWVAFHILMLKRFPADAKKVLARMQGKAVQADLSTRIETLEAYSAALLTSFMTAYPNGSIREFVDNMKRDMPGVKWLTSFSANVMCDALLKRGNFKAAFEVVDEVVRHGGRPDAVTLNTFLTAAKKDGSMEMAVAILRKFCDLHTESIALASTSEKPLTALPRVHDLSIVPNRISFRILWQIAWQRKYFNCLRVFWRYACCAGHVKHHTIKTMRGSATSKGARKGLAATEGMEGGARARLWSSWAAKFAMGVRAGLGPAYAAEVLSLARSSQILDQPLNQPSSELTEVPWLSISAATTKRQEMITADVGEVQSLKPTRSLADIAEEAWLKDHHWKKRLIGLPMGQHRHGVAEEMLDVMLAEGIEVPVEVGDAVGMTL